MYIFFINSGGKCDIYIYIYILLNLIIIVIKKIVKPMGWVRLNFFLPIIVGWVKKSPQPDPTRPMHTPSYCSKLKKKKDKVAQQNGTVDEQ